jgi:hypothetical protein
MIVELAIVFIVGAGLGFLVTFLIMKNKTPAQPPQAFGYPQQQAYPQQPMPPQAPQQYPPQQGFGQPPQGPYPPQ